MKYLTKIVWLLLNLCFLKTGSAQPSPNQKLDIYILIGQSNMAGRGPITPAFIAQGNDHVFMFNKDNKWILARHPLHFDKPKVVGVGPGLAFGIKMAKANPKQHIGLVPCAVGGTPIEHWVPGAFDSVTKTHPYDDALIRIKAAMKFGIIKGVIWHQGEANASSAKAKLYLTQLTALINRIRTELNDPNLPFIAGELGRYRKGYAKLNTELRQLPSNVAYTLIASSKGLKHKGDSTHFDSRSAQKLGKRYARQMIKVQRMFRKDH